MTNSRYMDLVCTSDLDGNPTAIQKEVTPDTIKSLSVSENPQGTTKWSMEFSETNPNSKNNQSITLEGKINKNTLPTNEIESGVNDIKKACNTLYSSKFKQINP